MSDASANTLLSQTSKTYLNGQVIDLDAALAPIGNLTVNNQPLTGYLAGVRLQDSHLLVQDSTKRDFSVDVAPMQINTFSMWSRNALPDQLQLSSQSEYLVGRGTTVDGFRIVGDSNIWSLGTPKFSISDQWSVNAQITQSVFNPWIQFGGMWGSVQSATMFETVLTYRNSWFQSQAGWITVDTKIVPGLINKVDTINAVWAEAGYTDNKIGLYGGVRPYIVSGSVHADLPTGIDFQGNLQYTKNSVDISNPVNGYIRAVYTDQLTKDMGYKFSGMLVDNGQYRIQTEIRYNY
jgi:hypothetical protein